VASFDQIPAELPITCVVGDELNVGLALKTGANVAVNVTGYTLEAKVYVPTYANPDGSFGSGAYTVGATVATFAVSVVSASAGTVNIGLTEQQTAGLSPAVGYRWFFRWVDTSGVTLTVLAGAFTARAP
jgi:hypothetical protein